MFGAIFQITFLFQLQLRWYILYRYFVLKMVVVEIAKSKYSKGSRIIASDRNKSTWSGWKQKVRVLWPYMWPVGKVRLQIRVLLCIGCLIAGRVVNPYVPIFYKLIGEYFAFVCISDLDCKFMKQTNQPQPRRHRREFYGVCPENFAAPDVNQFVPRDFSQNTSLCFNLFIKKLRI